MRREIENSIKELEAQISYMQKERCVFVDKRIYLTDAVNKLERLKYKMAQHIHETRKREEEKRTALYGTD